MSSSNFASFAPYTPPPDDPEYINRSTPSKGATRPWFPASSSLQYSIPSYQSGGIPTFNTSAAGGDGASEETEGQQNQWETRFGMRVDVLAAFAYILGPLSALLLLVIETQNDYVRFHAYQSALLTTPLLVLRMLLSLLQLPVSLRSIMTILIMCCQLFMAFRAYSDAAQNGLVRYHLPYIGPIADDWVKGE
ncbi:hypothetical protein NEOLEDRAFT_1125927 [Neolentinus lepideus HHB14362 ss-1]|uniref:Uncharacterized protein n=1 Tax=Neolentinus lepideus HHB14362 ss-1 TaxID=1314782 RepID=A0A165VYK3_9AGAM|nr:hypothetical protein NEOLEDRAFT_1125927 [Neolentinus lepideus HHB14362 ss-1]